jgi:TRAP-type C4-dicarboxylate transport system substrate-binding protein
MMKMSQKWSILIAGLLIVAIVLTGCATSAPSQAPAPAPAPSASSQATQNPAATSAAPAPALTKKIKITFATANPETDPKTMAARKLKALWEEQSKGMIEVAVFPAGQILTDSAMVEGIPAGLADIGYCNLGMWNGLVPEIEIIAGIGIYEGRDHYWAAREGGLEAYIAKKFEEKTKTKIVNWIYGGESSVFTNTKRELRLPRDFAGLKFRAPNKGYASMFASLGASGVVMPVAETYTSLQSGVIDGAYCNVNSWNQQKYVEVAKYMSRIPVTWAGDFGMAISLDVWNKWPKEVQDMITQGAAEMRKWAITYMDQQDEKLWTQAKGDKRVQVYDVPAQDFAEFVNLIKPGQLKTLEQDMGSKSIQDMLAIIDKFKKAK